MQGGNVLRIRMILQWLMVIHLIVFVVFSFGMLKKFFPDMRLSRETRMKADWGEYYEKMRFVNRVTPEDSLVVVPPHHEQFGKIGNGGLCSGFAFPRRILSGGNQAVESAHEGPVYRVVMPGFEYAGRVLDRHVFNAKFSLVLLREGRKRAAPIRVDFTTIQTTFFSVALAAVKLLLIVFSGLYMVRRFFGEQSCLGLWTASFLTGTVLSCLVYILFGFLGVPFSEHMQFIFLGLCSLPGLIVANKARLMPAGEGTPSSRLGILIVSVFFGLLFLKNFGSPLVGWDGIAIWGAKAKAIFAGHDLRGLEAYGAFPRYPPLVPVLMSQLAIGGEAAVNLVFPLFALCLYAVVYEVLRPTRFSPFLKCTLPLLIFVTGDFFCHSLVAYANMAAAVFVTKAMIMLPRLTKEAGSFVWVSLGVMLSGVFFARPEGVAYLILIVFLALWRAGSLGCPLKNALFLLLPFACVALWNAYYILVLHQPWQSLFVGGNVPFTVRGIFLVGQYCDVGAFAWNVAAGLLHPRHFGIILPVFIVLYLWRGRRLMRTFLFESIFVFVSVSGLILFCYYFATIVGLKNLFDTGGFSRYMISVVPLVFVIILRASDHLLHTRSET